MTRRVAWAALVVLLGLVTLSDMVLALKVTPGNNRGVLTPDQEEQLLQMLVGEEPQDAGSAINTIKVGIVRDPAAFDGPGCSLQLPADYKRQNERYVFLSDYEDNAVININGKDIKLKHVSHREPEGDPKKGDRSTWNYAGKGTTVRVDFVATGVCDPNDESCEVTYYDATITVTQGKAKRVTKVTGLCGS